MQMQAFTSPVVLCDNTRRLWFSNDCYALRFHSAAWLCNEQHGFLTMQTQVFMPAIVLRGQRPRRLWLSATTAMLCAATAPVGYSTKPGTATMPMQLLIRVLPKSVAMALMTIAMAKLMKTVRPLARMRLT